MGISLRTYSIALLVSVLYTVCAMPLVLLVPFLDNDSRQRMWRFLIVYYGQCIIYFCLKIWGAITYTDMRPEENAAGVFIANHRSASDAFLVAVLDRELVQILSYWPSKLPFWGFFAKRGGYLNIGKLAFEEFLSASCDILKKGVAIVSFPEGTRSGSKKMKQFHSGIFKVALEAKCPIYPLCIIGNENMPDRNFKMHKGKIEIFKLPSIAYEEYKYMSAFSLKKYVRSILKEKMITEEQD